MVMATDAASKLCDSTRERVSTVPTTPEPHLPKPWRASAGSFVQLFSMHQRSVHAYISTLVPSAADADDIMQETSLALWQKFPEFDPHRDFFRWACGVAYVAVLRFRRSTAKDKLWFNEELLELMSNDLLEREDTREFRRQALHQCIKKLDSSERRLIDARYSAGASVESVAQEFGRPPNAVYRALARIRDKLFDCITRTVARETRE
jgi:RNA polymerase sigma-70 factor, ECF subfamily